MPATNTVPETLITTYLEMTSRSDFNPAFLPTGPHHIWPAEMPDAIYYRFLYVEVGRPWRWRDRLSMDDAALHALLGDERVSVDVLYVQGVPAGFIELLRGGDEGRDVEVAYFGLRPPFFSQGYGKHLLSHGVARAWSEGARRVWLHTCNLDSPHAVPTYQKRGFRVYDVTHEPMPERYHH